MAKMMFNNLSSIVANTLTDSIKMIDIKDLHESEDNFFEVNRIEELAATILGQGGVKDNLIVKPAESGYEIISGHRRKAAVQYLIDQGANISHLLPCLVQNYSDDDTKMLDLILMNVSQRQVSDSELYKSYEIVNQIFQKKKETGEKFGKLREKLAETLGVSPAQVGKLQNIEKNAVPEIKKAVEDGEISLSTANEIARLDADEQIEIADSDLSSIKPKDIKKSVKEKVDTNVNFSNQKEDNDSESFEIIDEEKVDTNINFSNQKEDNYSESFEMIDEERVDININFSDERKNDKHDDMQSYTKENAIRLACALKRYSEDMSTVKHLAHYLHYDAEQLKEDMRAVNQYIDMLQNKIQEE